MALSTTGLQKRYLLLQWVGPKISRARSSCPLKSPIFGL